MTIRRSRQDEPKLITAAAMALAAALQAGCWFTFSHTGGFPSLATLLIPAIIGALMCLAYLRFSVPWIALVLSAVCLTGALAFRSEQTALWFGMFVTAQMTALSIRRANALYGAAACALPVLIQIYRGENPDIWYLGLLIFAIVGLFALCIAGGPAKLRGKADTTGESAKLRGRMARAGRRAHGESLWLPYERATTYTGVFLAAVLMLIAFYALFFTPQSYRNVAAFERMRALQSKAGELARSQEDQNDSDSNQGSALKAAAAALLKFILKILLWLAAILVVLILLYEIVMHWLMYRRRKRFKEEFTRERLFEMYRYLDGLCRMGALTQKQELYTEAERIAGEYAVIDGDLPGFMDYVQHHRFAEEGAPIDPQIHTAMADYCGKVCRYIYRSSDRKTRFKMRFVKAYV